MRAVAICKYSPDGTPITIRLSRVDGDVCLAVQDRGCGIADEDRGHLFTPFFRSEEARRGIVGLGLGLSIAKRLGDAFCGVLTVESRFGHGSTVMLRLKTTAA